MSKPSCRTLLKACLVTAATAVLGCTQSQPVQRVHVPLSPNEGGSVKTYERLRPIVPPDDEMSSPIPPPAFDDPPLVNQAPPEQPIYLDAYSRVGRPRVAVFVNRTIDGKLIPVAPRNSRDAGPSEEYLSSGQFDEAQAHSIDYEAIELVLTDMLSANGRITLVDPTMVRQRLSDEEVKDLQSGRPQALREIAEKLDADVLIQAQARPTRQMADGLGIRVLVEAMNTHGGESLARAFVDVPPPLEKQTINNYTRFLARKTMYELAGSWNAMASDDDRRNNSGPTTRP